MKKIIILFLFILAISEHVFANCDSCIVPRAGRDTIYSLGADKSGLFFNVRYEYQNWDTTNTSKLSKHNDFLENDLEHTHNGIVHEEDAHHDVGHQEEGSHDDGGHADGHSHNRAYDRFYHLSMGYNFSDEFTVFANLPYVEKVELQDSGAERSEGFGDLNLIGIWRAYKSESGYIGPMLGVKLPTGQTNERNSSSDLFEAEIQPGSGSTDFTFGGIFEKRYNPIIFRGNALYVMRNEGTQDYQFGDSTSLSFFADYIIEDSKDLNLFAGIDINYQHGNKDNQNEE